MKKNPSNKLVVILGPTASGKTDLAVKLAQRFNAEIVCADSRQIYSEMPIGTASPLQNQNLQGMDPYQIVRGPSPIKSVKLSGVMHHLFGAISPKKVFSAAQYQKLAIKTIKDIQRRGKMPLLVGGSAFYIYPVIEGWQFPKLKASQKLRKGLEKKTTKQLFEILKKLSPARTRTIDQNNKRRLIRAIEIAKQLGEVPKIIKKPIFDCLILGVNVSKTELVKRVEKRTAKMLKLGLEKEVKALVKKYGWTEVLRNTIGYAEWQNLKKGGMHLVRSSTKVASQQINLHTLQLAKKQMTWFKQDKKIAWVKNSAQAEKLMKNFLENTQNNGTNNKTV